ncbi:MAG: hypothetical protein QXO51_04195 [Halobacteria archaeon]
MSQEHLDYWTRKRLARQSMYGSSYRRKGHRCLHCGMGRRLTRHHLKRYGERTGRTVILCRPCHDAVHGMGPGRRG